MNKEYEYYKSLPYVREYPDGILEVKKHYDFDNMVNLGFDIKWNPNWNIKYPNFKHMASLRNVFIGYGNTPELAVKNLLTFNHIYLSGEFGFNNAFIKGGIYDKKDNCVYELTREQFNILSARDWSFLIESLMFIDNMRIDKFEFYPF